MRTIGGATLEVRERLIEVGGKMSQDLGLGRIVGQILVYLYLHEQEISLEQIADELGLSKAAVSIAARQLEALGLIRRSWKRGDRRSYYRTQENIGVAMQQGLSVFARQKLQNLSTELDQAGIILDNESATSGEVAELEFLKKRVGRVRNMKDMLIRILESPLVKFFVKS